MKDLPPLFCIDVYLKGKPFGIDVMRLTVKRGAGNGEDLNALRDRIKAFFIKEGRPPIGIMLYPLRADRRDDWPTNVSGGPKSMPSHRDFRERGSDQSRLFK